MGLKDKIPSPYKLRYRLIKRRWRDWKNRSQISFASRHEEFLPSKNKIQLSQPIRPSHLFENKLHNIKLGSQRIRRVLIRPGEVFSFWRSVGPPTSKNGFKKGRNIIKGELKEDYGGGLCQLSGIIHHLALLAGLEVVERYNHSVDIYTDETRFAPLGTDATVVFGYKDLRLRNSLNCPIQFNFDVKENEITAYVHSPKKIVTQALQFRESLNAGEKLIQLTNDKNELISQSIYQSK